jgi:hypothetical protein
MCIGHIIAPDEMVQVDFTSASGSSTVKVFPKCSVHRSSVLNPRQNPEVQTADISSVATRDWKQKG